jgi:hypothetical protein
MSRFSISWNGQAMTRLPASTAWVTNGRGVGERDLDPFDEALVAAGLLDRVLGRDGHDVGEVVDRDEAALEVCRGLDVGVRRDDQGAEAALRAGGRRAVGDVADVQALLDRDHHGDDVAEGELHVAGDDVGHGLGPAAGRGDLDVQALLLEEALLDAEPQGRGVGDRDGGDGDLAQGAVVAAVGARLGGVVVPAAAAGEDEGGGRHSCERTNRGLHLHSFVQRGERSAVGVTRRVWPHSRGPGSCTLMTKLRNGHR